MKPRYRTICALTAAAIVSGCTLPSRQSGRLGGLSALEKPATTQQQLEVEQPLPAQYAGSREMRSAQPAGGRATHVNFIGQAGSDNGFAGGVAVEHQAAPRQPPPATLPPKRRYGLDPQENNQQSEQAPYRPQESDVENGWDDASNRHTDSVARVAHSPGPQPAPGTSQLQPGEWPSHYGQHDGGIVVRAQGPDWGGHPVQTLPPRVPGANQGFPDPAFATGPTAPPGGAPFVPVGSGMPGQYGAQPQANTVFQPIPGVAGPGQPIMMPPFAPPAPDVPQDQFRDILIQPQETQTGRLMIGAGINSDAGLVGNLVIDEQNFDLFRPSLRWEDWVNGTAFRGAGQRFRLEAMPGTEVQRYSFNFQDPYFLDMPVSFGVSAFYFQRNYQDWDERRGGGGINLGYQFPERPDLSIAAGIRAESVNISDVSPFAPQELRDTVGNNDLYTARLSLAHDTRDSAFLPTEGHFISLAFEQGFGSYTFPRFEADFRNYWSFFGREDRSGRHILGASGKIGVSGSNTPVFEHFFAGGFSTLRGFAFRGASYQENGFIVGGEFELLTSLEYRFPLTANDMLFGSFFLDAGTVEQNARIYGDNFRVTPGFELRISVPAMGPIPIAVGLGVPIAHAPGDEIQNFHFFVGITR